MKATIQFWLERHPLAAPLTTLGAGAGAVARLAPPEWWTLHGTLLLVGLAIVLAYHFQQRYGRGALGEALDVLKSETAKLHIDATKIAELEVARRVHHERLDAIENRVHEMERTLESVRPRR